MAVTSRWRLHADRVIRDAMRDVPATATEKEVRDLLFPLYPFGDRSHLPYRHWKSAVNQVIVNRGLSGPNGSATLQLCDKIHWTGGWQNGRWCCIRVVCPWCSRARRPWSYESKGCIVCRHVYEQYQELSANDQLSAICISAYDGDDVAQCMVHDWLAERGYDDLAEQARTVWKRVLVA